MQIIYRIILSLFLALQLSLAGAVPSHAHVSGDGANVSSAGSIARSGLENNYLDHQQQEDFIAELDRCAKEDQDCIKLVIEKYGKLSLDQSMKMYNCTTFECLDQHLGVLDNILESGLISKLQSLGWGSTAMWFGLQQAEDNSGHSDVGLAIEVGEKLGLTPEEVSKFALAAAAFSVFVKSVKPKGKAPNRGFPCPSCFVAGTPIKTVSGYTDIENMKVGDFVLAKDTATGQIIPKRVSHVHIRPIVDMNSFFALTVSNGTDSEILRVTGEYPFWVEDKKQWAEVNDLKVGDTLIDYDGNADLTIRQSQIYPQINSGDAIPRGQVARDFDLTPGVPLREQGYPNGIPIEVRNFPRAGQ